MGSKRILVIDDDHSLCTLLSRFLTKNGFTTDTALSASAGIEKFKDNQFDLVLCDFRLDDKDGREVLKSIKVLDSQAVVIMITGYSDLKTAVDVIKEGAYDYISKPLIPDEILNVINKALQEKNDRKLRPQRSDANTEPSSTSEKSGGSSKVHVVIANDDIVVGNASSTKELYKQIELVAPTGYSVIIYGESGTGKEVMARLIHGSSDRRDKPFVALDCGTLSRELAGSELFGHVKGSFTGAVTDKEGHFELANGGTLFLDEVGNLSLDIQASLLRVIQERKFKRVGGTKEMEVDIRILVASNENLHDAFKKGKFREDLYHRLNEFSIAIPPLRHRKEDIPLFAEYFLAKANKELNKNVPGFDNEVIEKFLEYHWPGNLREMMNVIRRTALLANGGAIKAKTLPWEISKMDLFSSDLAKPAEVTKTNDGVPDLKESAARAEYDTIISVLKEVRYNKTKAAEILKIDRKTLYNKLKSYELDKAHSQ
jgi:two-component system response regulator HydG